MCNLIIPEVSDVLFDDLKEDDPQVSIWWARVIHGAA